MALAKSDLELQCLKSLKRTNDLFLSNVNLPVPNDPISHKSKIGAKIVGSEYAHVKDIQALNNATNKAPLAFVTDEDENENPGEPPLKKSKLNDDVKGISNTPSNGAVDSVIADLAMAKKSGGGSNNSGQLVEYAGNSQALAAIPGSQTRLALSHFQQFKKPKWHCPWKLKTVIAGHLGWVRSIAVEPGNEWFATGAADRTIKIWDLASGVLRTSFTGHISTVRGIVVSDRHNYLFSCGEDKMVKCWDLEQNKAIRYYHGHLSGVYALALHPKLDLLITAGRDSTCRVWDIRTNREVHVLTGHTNTLTCVSTQSSDPQIITGSEDSTVKLWDLGMGKCVSTLTHHKKGIRALQMHPTEYTFASASADNIKKWKLPHGEFISNFGGHNTIINTVALNNNNVFVSGGDNGSMVFWDWTTGYPFQKLDTIVQPGSLESEAGIYASTFDKSGTRFITCEADKSIKIYCEDDNATPENSPIDSMWRPNKDKNRF
jgi:pleiotropic regulator 1